MTDKGNKLIDKEFAPVRKSVVSVDFDKIVQDVKNDHDQMNKLRNIKLISRNDNKHKVKQSSEITKKLNDSIVTNSGTQNLLEQQEFLMYLRRYLRRPFVTGKLICPEYFMNIREDINKMFNNVFVNGEKPKIVEIKLRYGYSEDLFRRFIVKTGETFNNKIITVDYPIISKLTYEPIKTNAELMSQILKTPELDVIIKKCTSFPSVVKSLESKTTIPDFFKNLYQLIEEVNHLQKGKDNPISLFFILNDTDVIETSVVKENVRHLFESSKASNINIFITVFQDQGHNVFFPFQFPISIQEAKCKSFTEFNRTLQDLLIINESTEYYMNLNNNIYRNLWNNKISELLRNGKSILYKLSEQAFLSGQDPYSCLDELLKKTLRYQKVEQLCLSLS